MKKRLTLLVLCLSAVALIAAGCGDNFKVVTTGSPQVTNEQSNFPTDLVQTASLDGDLSTLVAAVKAAGLTDTLKGSQKYTVFAPNNQAFSGVQSTVDTLLKPENKADLKKVLTYHVVPGNVTSADLKDGAELTTVQGDKLKVSVQGKTVKVGDATVKQADIVAKNGLIHVIDKVLVPPAQ